MEYTGTVYIGVVGPEIEYGEYRDSVEAIQRRPGDSAPYYGRATKGYESRQSHLNKWLEETKHDFMLLLDHDMQFPSDTLERLRSHKLPYVSGLYMRRQLDPVAPVWYRPFRGKWPMEAWVGPVEKGRLHELGASGWGCILIHRDVALAVRELLKGEWEVLEDDMDVWPYDLSAILAAMRGLRALSDTRPDPRIGYPALEEHLQVLEREIRPLRADRDQIGSDIRFPFFARAAGFTLMGDPDVQPGHLILYPLSIQEYDSFSDELLLEMQGKQRKYVAGQQREWQAQFRQIVEGAK